MAWNQDLLASLSSVEALEGAGLIRSHEAHRLKALGGRFKVRVTPHYASLMKPSPDCPIRLQALPDLGEQDPALPEWAQEMSEKAFGRKVPWHADAIGDVARLAAPRLTHRYRNRAILHLSSQCAVYCRFCFRKEHLGQKEKNLYDGSLDPALGYLAENVEIREVILTGGDPLSVTDEALDRLLVRISRLDHIKTVRIHSRMAVTLPSRLTPELARVLGEDRSFQLVLVNHFNHARELTGDALAGLRRLRKAGVTLLNQSVLLRGVNDSVDRLTVLFQSLYEAGILPYYLHHPDWTPGTFQFRVSIREGLELVNQIRGRISGPALPEYVLDLPQGAGKISLRDARIKVIAEHEADGLQAVLYEMTPPHTRLESAPALYLDLIRIPLHATSV